MKKILEMLPFLGDSDLIELAKECLMGNVDLPLEQIFAFLSASDADTVFNEFRKENGEIDLTLLGENVDLTDILPFLSQKLIDDLYLSQTSQALSTEMLPFVSDNALHKLVMKYVENPNLDIDIDELYPFLSSKDISLLFKAYLSRHKKSKKE